jgi:preprotein translocase subunit SecD
VSTRSGDRQAAARGGRPTRGTGRLVLSLVFVGVLVVATLIGFALGLKPLLGLDLEGGLSVVLEAPSGTDKAVMDRTVDRIRDRVDALGVAEADISLAGSNLVQVQIPGLGGQGTVTQENGKYCVTSTEGKDLGCFDTRAQAEARAKQESVSRVLAIIGQTARLDQREVLQTIQPSDAAYSTTAFTTGVIKENDPYRKNESFKEADSTDGGLTTYQDTNGDGFFTAGTDPILVLGPVEITGADLAKAQAQYLTASGSQAVTNPGWRVAFTLNSAGAQKFAEVTTRLNGKQLAIVLDNVVQSAPTIQSPITNGSGEITGNFTEAEAKNLAVVLNSGALPVELTRQEIVTVSPTLGRESLHQGLIAGIVGLIALMLYLVFYYRLLGLVTWLGMFIWAVLAIGLVSVLGATIGYALTLAGIAGLIVSLGITADSYIVFYERLKDEIRHGKSLRVAVQPAFKRAWRTILTADAVTLGAAAILYLVAIGSVRGFALTLGLSTLLDMFVVYFYKRPTVFLIARNPTLANLPGMGLRSGLAADPVPVMGGER